MRHQHDLGGLLARAAAAGKRERKTEEADQLKMRIVTARRELQRIVEFNYVVINREDALDETVDQVLSIIKAEKSRVDWTPVIL